MKGIFLLTKISMAFCFTALFAFTANAQAIKLKAGEKVPANINEQMTKKKQVKMLQTKKKETAPARVVEPAKPSVGLISVVPKPERKTISLQAEESVQTAVAKEVIETKVEAIEYTGPARKASNASAPVAAKPVLSMKAGETARIAKTNANVSIEQQIRQKLQNSNLSAQERARLIKLLSTVGKKQ